MAKALYRQYRPQTFDQVLGQDRVVNVLKNQVQKGMISHAYLFAGERGCGKTTCAKIFAKAINCHHPEDGSPDLECENCISIENETTMDVVEMDAASNRRIDDIRQIKETVMYPPNNLKYKVYIIDEAHMITKEAFNALLKMMEEPPSHLVFILATTEIDKIPQTILSRVQKFEFNKIDKEPILKQIDIILDDLGIEMDPAGKNLIVTNAKGAMRDALSILDQVISSSKDFYSLSDVEEILGVVGFKDLYSLAININSYDKKASLEEVFKLRDNNKSNRDILDGLVDFYHDLLIYKSTMDESNFDSKEKLSYIKEFSKDIDSSRIMDSLEILSEYSEKMRYSENTDLILELAILRLIDYKDLKSLESRIRALEKKSQDSISDMVNSLVENKLRNLDLSSLDQKSDGKEIKGQSQENKNIKESYDDKGEEKQVEDTPLLQDPSKSNNEGKNEENLKENKSNRPYKEKESSPKKEKNLSNRDLSPKSVGKKLGPNDEQRLKNMIVEVSGPLVGTMFNIEGFNYDLTEKTFYLYYGDPMYHSFLENKKEEIEEVLKDFTNDDLEVKIISEDEKESLENTDQDEEIEKQANEESNQALNKLEEIFGDDLIIE